MVIPDLPHWPCIILCFVILGFYAISLVRASVAADLVSDLDGQIKSQTIFVKMLIADADTLLANAKSDAVKAECKKVYDALRYSDPMSNPLLASLESQITIKLAALSDEVEADDATAASAIVQELLILLKERNDKCKILK